MARKTSKSIKTDKKSNSSSINVKKGGKVIKKQPINVGKKVKPVKSKCPKCSKQLFNFNKDKSGVCVACVKNDTIVVNKSKKIAAPKSSPKSSKQVVGSPRKSYRNSSKTRNSHKSDSPKTRVKASPSKSVSQAKVGPTSKSKQSQASKTDSRGNKRSYTELSKGNEDKKTTKKRKTSTNSEQSTKRASRNKTPTVKGSEWMSTIHSKSVNQQEEKIKKGTLLKNKSPKPNSKLKENGRKKPTPIKTANTVKTNTRITTQTTRKPIKRLLKNKEQTNLKSKRQKIITSTTTSSKTTKPSQSGKDKSVILNKKKAVTRKPKTKEIKNHDVAKSSRRQSSRCSNDSSPNLSLPENVYIAKDILNGLLNSIPPVLIDNETFESDNVNKCDLESVKVSEDKYIEDTDQLKTVKSHQNKKNIDVHLDADLDLHNENSGLDDLKNSVELNSNICVAKSLVSLPTPDLVIKHSIEQNDNKGIDLGLTQNKDSKLSQVLLNESKEDKNKTLASLHVGSIEKKCSDQENKTILIEKEFDKNTNDVYSSNEKFVEHHSCDAIESNDIIEDDKQVVLSGSVENYLVENKEISGFEKNDSKVNVNCTPITKVSLEKMSEENNSDTKIGSLEVKENIAATIPLSLNRCEQNGATLSPKSFGYKNLKEIGLLSTESNSEEKKHDKIRLLEEVKSSKNALCQEISNENSSSNVEFVSTAVKEISDNGIEINSDKDAKSSNRKLANNNECDKNVESVGILRNKVSHEESTDGIECATNITDSSKVDDSVIKSKQIDDSDTLRKETTSISVRVTDNTTGTREDSKTINNVEQSNGVEVLPNNVGNVSKSLGNNIIENVFDQVGDVSTKEVECKEMLSNDKINIDSMCKEANNKYTLTNETNSIQEIVTDNTKEEYSSKTSMADMASSDDTKSASQFDQNLCIKQSTKEGGNDNNLSVSNKTDDVCVQGDSTEEAKCNKLSNDMINNINSKNNEADNIRKEFNSVNVLVTNNTMVDHSIIKDFSGIDDNKLVRNEFDQNIDTEKLQNKDVANVTDHKEISLSKQINDLPDLNDATSKSKEKSCNTDDSECNTLIDSVTSTDTKLDSVCIQQSNIKNHPNIEIDIVSAPKTDNSTTDIHEHKDNIQDFSKDGIASPVILKSEIKISDSKCDEINKIEDSLTSGCDHNAILATDKEINISHSEQNDNKDSVTFSTDHNDLLLSNKKGIDSIYYEKINMKDSSGDKLVADSKTTFSITNNENDAMNHCNTECDDILPTLNKCSPNKNSEDPSINGKVKLPTDSINNRISDSQNASSLEIAKNVILSTDDVSDKNDDITKYSKSKTEHGAKLPSCDIVTDDDGKTNGNELIKDNDRNEIVNDNTLSTATKITHINNEESSSLPKISPTNTETTNLPTECKLSQNNLYNEAKQKSDNLLLDEASNSRNICHNENNDTTLSSLHPKKVGESIKKLSPEKKISIDKSSSSIAKVNADIKVTEIDSVNISIKVQTRNTEHVLSIEHDKSNELHIQTENCVNTSNESPAKLVETSSQKETCSENSNSEFKIVPYDEEAVLIKNGIVSSGDIKENDSAIKSKETGQDNNITQTMTEPKMSYVDDKVNIEEPVEAINIDDDDVESMQCNSETLSSNRMSVDEDNTEMDLDTECTSDINPSSEMNVDCEINMDVN